MTHGGLPSPRMQPALPENPHIVVVGAGAVGGFFGALLFKAGANVTFLLRPQTYTHVVRSGLKIASPHPALGHFLFYPPCVRGASELAHADLIILAVKCYDLPQAIAAITPWVLDGAILLTLQNGLESEERILSRFSSSCVVAGVAYITARLARMGVIEHFRRGTITLGAWSDATRAQAAWVHQTLTRANISCQMTDDIRKVKWEKLCWNATFNPLSVILDYPISLILDSPDLLALVRSAIAEIIAVAAAEGVTLDADIAETTLSVSDGFRDFYTSMHEDFRNGKPNEIESLNGDIMRRGRRHGIPTPIHDLLRALILGLEEKRRLAAKTRP